MKKITLYYHVNSRDRHILKIIIHEKTDLHSGLRNGGVIVEKTYEGMWERARPILDGILHSDFESI